MDVTPSYTFTALRGVQAGRTYYSVMCPLTLVPKIFLFDEEELTPELRAQRTLNRSRIPQMVRYILENPQDYVFSSLTTSVDGDVFFEPFLQGVGDIGRLRVPMFSRFVINDGQHRRAAIEEALKVMPELGQETISVVIFVDAGLRRSQQMFADLNNRAVRPTKSIGILYDFRDPVALLAVRLADEHPVFRGLTEKEKTSISNRSRKLFTLSSLYQATRQLLGLGKKDAVTEEHYRISFEFWTEVDRHIPDWNAARLQRISSKELREEYVHAHGVALQGLSVAGATLLAQDPRRWKQRLKALAKVDWSRNNTAIWDGRAMVAGRINRTQNNVKLTANYLKQVLDLSLTAEEDGLERQLLKVERKSYALV